MSVLAPAYLSRYTHLTVGLTAAPKMGEPFDVDLMMRYKILWLLVIRQAIFDYVKWKDSDDLSCRRDAEDAGKWLFDRSSLDNGLQKLCELVEVDIKVVRRTAKELTPKDVKKMEFQDRGPKFLETMMGVEEAETEDADCK
jgi:hypothetical protein